MTTSWHSPRHSASVDDCYRLGARSSSRWSAAKARPRHRGRPHSAKMSANSSGCWRRRCWKSIFQRGLATRRGATPAERTHWRVGIYAQILSVMSLQGGLGIERMCQLAQVSRAGFYRSLQAHQPMDEKMAVRSAIQHIALEHRRRYGYRRITAELRHRGFLVHTNGWYGLCGKTTSWPSNYGPAWSRRIPIMSERSRSTWPAG